MRVRERARELARRRERQWVIRICCAAVTLCTAFTSVLLWLGFAWIGQQARLSTLVWGTCYATFCLTPALLTGIRLRESKEGPCAPPTSDQPKEVQCATYFTGRNQVDAKRITMPRFAVALST